MNCVFPPSQAATCGAVAAKLLQESAVCRRDAMRIKYLLMFPARALLRSRQQQQQQQQGQQGQGGQAANESSAVVASGATENSSSKGAQKVAAAAPIIGKGELRTEESRSSSPRGVVVTGEVRSAPVYYYLCSV